MNVVRILDEVVVFLKVFRNGGIVEDIGPVVVVQGFGVVQRRPVGVDPEFAGVAVVGYKVIAFFVICFELIFVVTVCHNEDLSFHL